MKFPVVISIFLHLVQVLALVTPRNGTDSTNNTVDSGGMSHVVETSIIVVLSTSCYLTSQSSSDIVTRSIGDPLSRCTSYLSQMELFRSTR
jgi:hypothetical protein